MRCGLGHLWRAVCSLRAVYNSCTQNAGKKALQSVTSEIIKEASIKARAHKNGRLE